jgi:hypothetical protein
VDTGARALLCAFAHSYNVSLHALWHIYGNKRGLILLEDAKTQYDASMGANYIYWQISNLRQRFCVLPVKDEGSGKIGAMAVWVE